MDEGSEELQCTKQLSLSSAIYFSDQNLDASSTFRLLSMFEFGRLWSADFACLDRANTVHLRLIGTPENTLCIIYRLQIDTRNHVTLAEASMF